VYISLSRVTRPVLNNFKVSIPVSTQADEWIAAEVLRDEFTHIQSQLNAVDSTAQLENEAEATIELSARFLAHVATSIAKDPQSMHARTALLLNVLKHFTSAYLATKDIHTLASGFDTEMRKTVLSAYFRAVAALQPAPVPPQPASALPTAASSGKASIFALFGGQGTNEVYFDELQPL
jgi:fatty acid synthase subunit alpha, fungi type